MKKSKQSIIKNKYFWIAIALLIVGLFLWNYTETNRQDISNVRNSVDQKVEKNEIDINIPSGKDFGEDNVVEEINQSTTPNEEKKQGLAKETGKHVTTEEEIVIELAKPPSETEDKLPSHYKLLKIGDIDDAIRNLSVLKDKIELELEKTPNDKELLEDLLEVEKEIEKLKIEREKLVNGDF